MSAENFKFLSSATGFLVFLTVFGCENPRIRTQIVHLSMREEFKDTIFVKKILWPKFSKNEKTNPIFPLKALLTTSQAMPYAEVMALVCANLLLWLPKPFQDMAEDHRAPEAGKLLSAWTSGRKETENRQRASGTKSA